MSGEEPWASHANNEWRSSAPGTRGALDAGQLNLTKNKKMNKKDFKIQFKKKSLKNKTKALNQNMNFQKKSGPAPTASPALGLAGVDSVLLVWFVPVSSHAHAAFPPSINRNVNLPA